MADPIGGASPPWVAGGGRPYGERGESIGEGEGDSVGVGGGVIWWWRWILMEKKKGNEGDDDEGDVGR